MLQRNPRERRKGDRRRTDKLVYVDRRSDSRRSGYDRRRTS